MAPVGRDTKWRPMVDLRIVNGPLQRCLSDLIGALNYLWEAYSKVSCGGSEILCALPQTVAPLHILTAGFAKVIGALFFLVRTSAIPV